MCPTDSIAQKKIWEYSGTSNKEHSLYKGHNRIHLHSKDTFRGRKWLFLHTYNTFVTTKKWTTSLKRTNKTGPNVSYIWRFHCTGIQILIGTLACGHNREVTSLLKRKVHCNNIESVCNYSVLLNQLNDNLVDTSSYCCLHGISTL